MRRELFPTSDDIHGAECRCRRCEPYQPSTPLFRDAATLTAAQLLAPGAYIDGVRAATPLKREP